MTAFVLRSAPARFVRSCRSRDDRAVLLAVAACAAFLVWKAAHLRYRDLVFGYPFVTYDSFQWMVDSLLYRGREVEAVYRNPGLPLVLALLGAAGSMAWLPLVNVALLGVFVMYLVLLLRRHFDPVPTAVALVLVFFTFSLQAGFDYVLADQWAVTFQLAAVYHLSAAEEDAGHLRPFAVFVAVSFLFQYAIVALAPAFLVYVLAVLRRRAADRRRFDRALVQGIALGLAIVSPVFVYKAIRFGNPLHSGVVQFPLVKPHFFGVVFYALNSLAFFGLPAALVVAWGFLACVRERGAALLVAAGVISYFVFWVLLYLWLDPRFLLYFVPFTAFCLARGLVALHVEEWLGGRGSTLPQAMVGWGALAFAVLCGLYERSDPYSRNEIPIAPQTEIVLGMQPITRWEGNVTISLAGLRLADAEGIPAVHFLRDYYRVRRAAADPGGEQEAGELKRIRDRLPADFRLAACGRVPTDYRAAMRREIALEHRLEPCGGDAPYRLLAAGDPVPAADQLLFSGTLYRLVRRTPPPGSGSVTERRPGP